MHQLMIRLNTTVDDTKALAREHNERTLGFHCNYCIPLGWRAGASCVCGNVHSGFENDLH